MTAADRPSVTDDARAEAVRIIDSSVPDDVPGYRIRYAEKAADALIDRGLLAAGRAETNTATTEDAVEDAYRLAYDVMRHHPGIWHNSLRAAVEALAAAGLLATARTRSTETTDAQVLAALNAMHPRAAAPSLDYWGSEADKMRAALRAAWTEADQ